MFFLGFAGSFMPYLLLTGIVFVLTMIVGNENLSQVDSTSNAENKILKVNDADNDNINSVDCYYFFTKDFKVKHKDRVVKNIFFKSEVSQLWIFYPKKVPFFLDSLYFSQYTSRYFGLSPPEVMV